MSSPTSTYASISTRPAAAKAALTCAGSCRTHGVDTDYPVHRHLLWGKQIAATLGGSSSDLARLGAQLASGVEVLA